MTQLSQHWRQCNIHLLSVLTADRTERVSSKTVWPDQLPIYIQAGCRQWESVVVILPPPPPPTPHIPLPPPPPPPNLEVRVSATCKMISSIILCSCHSHVGWLTATPTLPQGRTACPCLKGCNYKFAFSIQTCTGYILTQWLNFWVLLLAKDYYQNNSN